MRLIMAVATGLYTGYLSWAPGTWGSLLGLPLHWLLTRLPPALYAVSLVGVAAVAVFAAGGAEKILDRKDPGAVVIDEIAGMLVALIGAPQAWWAYLAGLLLFRLFDITKPFPARWCDRHLNGGLGIVLDDLVAGAYAMLCLQLVLRLVP